jgi:hypothetical protein
MKKSFGKLVLGMSVAVVLTSLVLTDVAEARGGGGVGGGGGARAGGGGGGGGARQGAQVNNSRADVRSNDVRSTSVNNVNVDRNVNVNVQGGGCSGRCGGWDHPVAAAAVVTGAVVTTAAVVGSIVATPPPGCVPVNYGGMVYQQCGGTWYAPEGPQYVVVNPPY